jgi:hypothetical protein
MKQELIKSLLTNKFHKQYVCFYEINLNEEAADILNSISSADVYLKYLENFIEQHFDGDEIQYGVIAEINQMTHKIIEVNLILMDFSGETTSYEEFLEKLETTQLEVLNSIFNGDFLQEILELIQEKGEANEIN